MKKWYILTAVAVAMVISGFTYSKFNKPSAEKLLDEKNGLKLYEITDSPKFPDAALTLKTPKGGEVLPEGIDSFYFEVENYVLGAQTPDAGSKLCANSAKGQHIHFIMDNEPYEASYSPTVGYTMKPGHHVLLAFLSRSYHESLKTTKAYVLKEFNVGPEVVDDFNETAPQIFYSRPKGDYVGDKEVKKLLLDFYVINCKLSPKGYKVRATVNGTEFILTKWAPYAIEGLPLGDVKVKLELLDNKNNLVPSAYNGVERTAKLKM
jgi:hypothetical protein